MTTPNPPTPPHPCAPAPPPAPPPVFAVPFCPSFGIPGLLSAPPLPPPAERLP